MMFTWGEIRVGYYVVIAALVWLFNGTASAVFLGILLAMFFEQPFKLWVFNRFTVVNADKGRAKAAVTEPPTSAAAPKPTSAKPKTAKTGATKKPKTAGT